MMAQNMVEEVGQSDKDSNNVDPALSRDLVQKISQSLKAETDILKKSSVGNEL